MSEWLNCAVPHDQLVCRWRFWSEGPAEPVSRAAGGRECVASGVVVIELFILLGNGRTAQPPVDVQAFTGHGITATEPDDDRFARRPGVRTVLSRPVSVDQIGERLLAFPFKLVVRPDGYLFEHQDRPIGHLSLLLPVNSGTRTGSDQGRDSYKKGKCQAKNKAPQHHQDPRRHPSVMHRGGRRGGGWL